MRELGFQLILIVLSSEQILSLFLPSHLTPSGVSKCISQILKIYFGFARKISIKFANNSDNIANSILLDMDAPVIVNALEYQNTRRIEGGMSVDVVVILNEVTDLANILKTTLWYGDSCFLLVLKSINDLNYVFDIFWENRIVNVFALVQIGHNANIHTYLPYSSKNCDFEYFIIDKWRNGTFLTGGISQIQDTERIKNMNYCPVNISIVDAKPFSIFKDECNCNATKHPDGVEGKMMTEIAKVLNFNATYYLPRDGELWGYTSPKPRGAVGEVFTKKSEIAIGMFGPNIERFHNLDFSVTYSHMECSTFGVPKGMRGKQKIWIIFLISEFFNDVWGAFFCTVMATFLVFWIIDKFKKYFKSSVCLMFYVIFITFGVPVIRPQVNALKILFLAWAWISFILMSAYQGSLSSKLTVPTADKNIKHLNNY